MKFASCLLLALAAVPALAEHPFEELENAKPLLRQRKLSSSSDECCVPPESPFYTCIAYGSGAQEVPTVDTATKTAIKMSFRKDFSEMLYDLDVTSGEAITQGHLHCAPAGANGPVMATLLNPDIPIEGPGGVDIDGDATYGSLTNDEITATECGEISVSNVASLFAATLAGNVYLNIHSEANPSGETRAQIFECYYA